MVTVSLRWSISLVDSMSHILERKWGAANTNTIEFFICENWHVSILACHIYSTDQITGFDDLRFTQCTVSGCLQELAKTWKCDKGFNFIISCDGEASVMRHEQIKSFCYVILWGIIVKKEARVSANLLTLMETANDADRFHYSPGGACDSKYLTCFQSHVLLHMTPQQSSCGNALIQDWCQ